MDDFKALREFVTGLSDDHDVPLTADVVRALLDAADEAEQLRSGRDSFAERNAVLWERAEADRKRAERAEAERDRLATALAGLLPMVIEAWICPSGSDPSTSLPAFSCDACNARWFDADEQHRPDCVLDAARTALDGIDKIVA